MTVVIGYVPTREGRAALEHGFGEALRRSLPVVVVSSRRDTDSEDSLDGDLTAWREKLSDAGLELEVRDLAGGADPADDLLRVAEEVDAALLVIGLRRRSPVGKLLLGSNAQKILLGASCPVLAVKGPAGR